MTDQDPGDEDVPQPPRWRFGRFYRRPGYIGYGMSILRQMIRYPDEDQDGGDEDDYHNYWCPYVGGVDVPSGTFRERDMPPAGLWNGFVEDL